MTRILAFLCLVCVSFAQNPPARVIGEVTGKTARGITVQTNNRQTVTVQVTDETKVLRVPPGETSLSKATAMTFDELMVGDRVLARTSQIIVMSRSDLDQKQAAERAEWQKRGVAGRITGITGDSITVTTSLGQKLVIGTTPKTSFRRYAPESIRFSDAKPSAFSELKVGDQLRVLGDRSGDTITAEVIVSGALRNFAATVVSVDAKAGELRLTDLETKKLVVVKVNSDTMARRLPPMMAQMLASRRSGEGAVPGAPRSPAPSASPGPARGIGVPRDLGSMFERMPALKLEELKPGDALIVASTAPAEGSSVTAIAIVAGVEPLLTGPPTDRRLSGPWNFDINIIP